MLKADPAERRRQRTQDGIRLQINAAGRQPLLPIGVREARRAPLAGRPGGDSRPAELRAGRPHPALQALRRAIRAVAIGGSLELSQQPTAVFCSTRRGAGSRPRARVRGSVSRLAELTCGSGVAEGARCACPWADAAPSIRPDLRSESLLAGHSAGECSPGGGPGGTGNPGDGRPGGCIDGGLWLGGAGKPGDGRPGGCRTGRSVAGRHGEARRRETRGLHRGRPMAGGGGTLGARGAAAAGKLGGRMLGGRMARWSDARWSGGGHDFESR